MLLCDFEHHALTDEKLKDVVFTHDVIGDAVGTYIEVQMGRFKVSDIDGRIYCSLKPVENEECWLVVFKSFDFVIVQNEIYGEILLPIETYWDLEIGDVVEITVGGRADVLTINMWREFRGKV